MNEKLEQKKAEEINLAALVMDKFTRFETLLLPANRVNNE